MFLKYGENIYRVLDDNNMSTLEPVPTEIINKTVIYDSQNNYRLFYCQIPEEYGNSISTKRGYLKKVIHRFSREF